LNRNTDLAATKKPILASSFSPSKADSALRPTIGPKNIESTDYSAWVDLTLRVGNSLDGGLRGDLAIARKLSGVHEVAGKNGRTLHDWSSKIVGSSGKPVVVFIREWMSIYCRWIEGGDLGKRSKTLGVEESAHDKALRSRGRLGSLEPCADGESLWRP